MYKIPTLFERDEKTHRVVPRWNPVVDMRALDIAEATEKVDGTAVMIQGGRLYARQTIGEKDAIKPGWLPAGPPVNGQIPGWVPCRRDDPQHKWHWEAWDGVGDELLKDGPPITARRDYTWLPDGTYELVGPKVQGNVYGLDKHKLWVHGATKVFMPGLSRDPAVAMGYLQEFLTHAPIEGLVWWARGPQPRAIAKIKARDFGLKWPRQVPASPIAATASDA